jgi:hypothetical protein
VKESGSFLKKRTKKLFPLVDHDTADAFAAGHQIEALVDPLKRQFGAFGQMVKRRGCRKDASGGGK